MAVLGEGRAITRQHIEKLAKTHGISPKRVVAVIDEVRATLADWPSHARDTGVGVSMAPVSKGLARFIHEPAALGGSVLGVLVAA